MQQMIFVPDFIACSTCFGQYFAHHQELESIIQMVAACGIWYLLHLVGILFPHIKFYDLCIKGMRALSQVNI